MSRNFKVIIGGVEFEEPDNPVGTLSVHKRFRRDYFCRKCKEDLESYEDVKSHFEDVHHEAFTFCGTCRCPGYAYEHRRKQALYFSCRCNKDFHPYQGNKSS